MVWSAETGKENKKRKSGSVPSAAYRPPHAARSGGKKMTPTKALNYVLKIFCFVAVSYNQWEGILVFRVYCARGKSLFMILHGS